jgi:hypothetical protein
MLEVRHVTARGHGRWNGEPYALALVTTARTWSDSDGGRNLSRTTWEVHLPQPLGDRRFASEQERDAFLTTSFTELALHDEPWGEARPGGHQLAGLLGARLDAVTSLEGTLELRFGGLQVYLHAHPDVRVNGSVEPAAGADRLTALVGARLAGVDELLDLGLVLDFDDGTRLTVDLREGPWPLVEFSGTWAQWGPGSLPD